MKKKEIEVWVNPEKVHQGAFNVFSQDYNGRITDDLVKATLTIELPERKVEITESQFEKAFDEALEIRGMCKAFYPELKQKLFGGDV